MVDEVTITGGRFAVLPTNAVADVRLSRRDVFILSVLTSLLDGNMSKRRDGWFQISQSVVARLAGTPRTSVNASVKKLEALGYLDKRPRANSAGGTDPCEYRVIQDGYLDPAHDRWRLAAPPQGVFYFSESQETQGVESRDRGVAPADAGVEPADSGVAKPDTPRESQETQGVAKPDTPPFDSTLENLTVDTSRNSNRLESRRRSNEQNWFESNLASPERIGSTVNAFLALRQDCFPGAMSGTSSREKLVRQIEDLLSRGATLEVIEAVLRERMPASAAEGLEAPAGVTRYRNDIMKATKAAGNGPSLPLPPPPPRRRPPPDAPDSTIDPSILEQWRAARDSIVAGDAKGIAKAWLTVESFLGLKDGTATFGLPSVMACDQVAVIAPLVSEACAATMGAKDVLFIRANADRHRLGGRIESRTGS